MLAKVIKLRNDRGGRVSAAPAIDYLSRDLPDKGLTESLTDYAARDGVSGNDSVEGGTFNLEGLDVATQADRDLAVKLIDYVSEAGRRKTHFETNPLYHSVLSWRAGEQPTKEQAREAVARALKALGMKENQALFVIHRDKEDHHHIHCIVNRVHPEKHILTGPPRYDYFVLDKVCRETEIAQGWQHDHGPHVVVDGQIRRLTKAQRKTLGLLGSDKAVHAQTPASRMAEVHSGIPSFADWMRSRVAGELVEIAGSGKAGWQDLHAALARRGIRAKQRGGGLVFVTQAEGRETSTKASGVDYRFSMGRLEKAFGAYQPPAAQVQPDAVKTYARFMHNVMTGAEPGLECPGRTGGSPERDRRREERTVAREALADRYKAERAEVKATQQQRRQTFRNRQSKEKADLLADLRARKPYRIAELEAAYGSKAISKGLWAAERAAAIESQQARHKIERADFQKLSRMEWPAWLERQAEAGDQAAISALRGIRYREQRKSSKSRAGFEGEDLSDGLEPHRDSKPGNGGEDKGRGRSSPMGGIEGELARFSLSSARFDIDHEHQRIIYRDEHGEARMTDSGPRIDVHHSDDRDAIRAGLMLASQKFGGEVYITGSADFRERAAREAVCMGIKVADADLQHVVEDEKQRLQEERRPAGGQQRQHDDERIER